MWLYDNWRKDKVLRGLNWHMGVWWSIFVIVSGTFLMVGGTCEYCFGLEVGPSRETLADLKNSDGTIVELIGESKSKPWGCANNSGSSK